MEGCIIGMISDFGYLPLDLDIALRISYDTNEGTLEEFFVRIGG